MRMSYCLEALTGTVVNLVHFFLDESALPEELFQPGAVAAGEGGAAGRVAYFFSGRPVTSPDELARLARRLERLRQMRTL